MNSIIRFIVGIRYHTNPAPAKPTGENRKHYDLWQKTAKWNASSPCSSEICRDLIETRYGCLKQRVKVLNESTPDPDDDFGEPLEDFEADVPVRIRSVSTFEKILPFSKKCLVLNLDDCPTLSSSGSVSSRNSYIDPAWVPDENIEVVKRSRPET